LAKKSVTLAGTNKEGSGIALALLNISDDWRIILNLNRNLNNYQASGIVKNL